MAHTFLMAEISRHALTDLSSLVPFLLQLQEKEKVSEAEKLVVIAKILHQTASPSTGTRQIAYGWVLGLLHQGVCVFQE